MARQQESRTLSEEQITKLISDAIAKDRADREDESTPEQDKKRCQQIAREVVRMLKAEMPERRDEKDLKDKKSDSWFSDLFDRESR